MTNKNEITTPAVYEISKEQLEAVRNALWKLGSYAIRESLETPLELDMDRLERYAEEITALRLELPFPKTQN
jgi:hypothetical protein